MNKKTRRKKFLKEFACYGFEVKANLIINTKEEYFNVWDSIIDFMEDRGFSCGGTSNETEIWFMVDKLDQKSSKFYNSPTSKDREEIINFLNTIPYLINIKIGDWVDCNYLGKKHNYKG